MTFRKTLPASRGKYALKLDHLFVTETAKSNIHAAYRPIVYTFMLTTYLSP